METIVEEDLISNASSAPPADMAREDLSEAGSSVYVPTDGTTAEKILCEDSDSEEDSDNEDIHIDNTPPSPPSKQESQDNISTDSEDNDVIETALTEIADEDSGDSSDLGERDKKYDLGGSYDLGAAISPSSEKKYDLGSFFNTTTADPYSSSTSKNDSQTMSIKTLNRSGSSIYILHKWMTDRNWNAARSYLISADNNHSRLQASVSYKNDDGETSLHIACRKRAPMDIVRSIINIGGNKSVMEVDTYGGSLPLHHACHFNAGIDLIKFLVYVGGTESVNKKDSIGNLPLHWALSKNASYEIIKLLIDMGGQETVTAVNKIGWNTLHAATFFSSKFKVVKLLVDTGGPSIAKHLNRKGDTPLDILYERNPFDTRSIMLVQDQLGTDKELMTWLSQETVDRTMHWIRRQPVSAQESGFSSPFIQMILNESFVNFRFLCVILLDLVAQIVLVRTLSFGVHVENWFGYKDIAVSSITLLICSISWLGFRCVVEMFTTPIRSWVVELSNWFNVSQTIFVIWSILILGRDGITNDYEAGISVATLGLAWFRSVFVLGDLFYEIAVFARALQRVAMKLIAFSITSVLVVMGFAHMFYTATKWEERFCLDSQTEDCLVPSLNDSYYAAFTEFLNADSLFRDESYLRDKSYRMILIFVFAVLVQLLLLNVLIAEIINSFYESKSAGKKAFWQRRYHYVTEFSNIYRALGYSKGAKTGNLTVKDDDDEKKIPSNRFAFSTAHHDVFPGDFYHFRKWWMKGAQAPDVLTRLRYFMKWSSFDEIFFPGPSFERVISGSKKDASNYSARILLYAIFPIMVVVNVVCFALGLITFGLLWPKWMRTMLFSGKVEFGSTDGQALGRHMDVMKNEIKSIHNAVKAEKFAVKSMEDDIKSIRSDLKVISGLLLRRSDESIYSEDEEVSDILSDSSSDKLGA
jgi:ankyrin repeat protein